MKQSQEILEKLGKVLPKVESPARYMGGEANGVRKDRTLMTGSIALAFPDLYEMGMSHNGTRVLYHTVNRESDLLAEVAFAPWTDMAALMREHGIPLYTHESWSPVREFDVLGISLQTELNFTNVPYLLDLAGIPVWSRERSNEDPIVAGGGPSMANPEPIADFFDLLVLGDGEKLTPVLVRKVGEWRRAGCPGGRAALLKELSAMEGVYVPSLVEFVLGPQGELIPARPATGSYKSTTAIKRTWVPVLDPADYPIQNLVPNMGAVHDRFAVEVMRGCTQGCRFCQAGYWYRPNRELRPDAVIDIAKRGMAATGERELGLLSLSSADYGPIEAVTDVILCDPEFDRVDVSLPSLRANSFGQSLAAKVSAIKGGRSATFAPETGSERLRKIINKTITDDEMVEAAENVFANGFNKIKLYTMVGLPTENMEDMEAFCGLIRKLVEVGRRHSKANQITASVGIFIPKTFTPMQWSPFMDKETVLKHVRFVKESFRGHPNVKVNYADWETSCIEAFYSRGDRSLAPMILEASRAGQVFESHGEKIDYPGWEALWQKHGYSYERMSRARGLDEVFPWDFMHIGVTKAYLRSEHDRMFDVDAPPVYDCKWGDCQKCGIPGNGSDTQLAPGEYRGKVSTLDAKEAAAAVRARLLVDTTRHFDYGIVFTKQGMSRFLPHQNMLSLFERSLIRMGLPVRFSQGFSPKPKISNTGALPLGLESVCERISVELLEPLDLETKEALMREISLPFPEGMRVLDLHPLQGGRLANPVAIEYVYKGPWDRDLLRKQAEGVLGEVQDHRGRTFPLGEHVQSLAESADGHLVILLHTNNTGNTMSPYTLLTSLLGITDAETRVLKMVKTKVIFAG